MKRKIIVCLIFIVCLFISAVVEVSACVNSKLPCAIDKNFIVQDGNPIQLFGQNIVRMKRQYTETDVFCIKKGASSPANGSDGDWTYYECATSKDFDGALRAGIGYAINWFNSSTKSNNKYARAQIAIHKILGEKNGGTTVDLKGVDKNFNKLYKNMLEEYNAYNSAFLKLSTSSLFFTLKDGYFVSNYITVTKKYLSSYNYSLKINGVSYGTNYVELNDNKIRVKIPSELITTSTSISLNLSSTRSYNMANMKDCASNKQPIAESYVTSTSKDYSASASGTITPDYCIANFKANDKNSRIELYEILKSQGKNYNNLLNFNELDAEKACKNVSCDYNKEYSCFNALFNNNVTFNENNLSCYNDYHSVSDSKIYCLTTFNLKNYIEGNKINFTSINGQMIKELLSNPIATGILTQKCYSFSPLPESLTLKYSDYVGKIKFDNKELIYNVDDTDKITNLIQNGNEFSITIPINYSLPEVYVKNGSGKVSENNCDTCKSLGNGILTKFMYSDEKIILPFEMNFERNIFDDINISSDSEKSCTYTPFYEIIIENNLQLEYRSIDPKNPFPGKSGNFRKVGKNWCDGLMCSGNAQENDLVKNVIINRNDSYNKTGVGAKYTITLTPSDIRIIREYNKLTTYDDYTLYCENDGNDCYSRFLNGMKNGTLEFYNTETNKIEKNWVLQNKTN